MILFSKNYSQIVSVPDINFKAKLLESSATNNIAKDLNGNPVKIDQNNDGEIQISEAENISALSINNRDISIIFYFFVQRDSLPIKEIFSLEGINSFKNLKILDCSFAKLTSLDFTNLSNLTQIYCDHNKITEFTNFQYVTSLFALDCSNNKITTLDLRNSSLINVQGEEEVLFRFENNNFQYLNLQNNKKTSWVCLCSPIDTTCAFSTYSGYPFFNTCTYVPPLSGNPLLTEVLVNCGEKSNFENFAPVTINFTDNCGVASTNEADLKANFKIFPNPAKDFINIKTKEKITEISILDYSGKLISKQQSDFTKIAVGQLPKGSYILKITFDQKEVNFKVFKD